jgi:hypothetical protein
LLKNGPNASEWQWTPVLLLEKFKQVLFQHLKYQTDVVLVLEGIVYSDKIEFISIFFAKR